MGQWTRVCSDDDLAEGQVLSVDGADQKLILVRKGSTIYATNQTCTHADADLSLGFVAPGAGPNGEPGVRCPLHFSIFDMGSGVPLNPPATVPLCTYKTQLRDGQVYVEI